MRSAIRSAIRSLTRSSRAKTHRSRRLIARYLAPSIVLLILGAAVVLSSVVAGARGESRKSAAGAEQKRRTKSVADVWNEKGRVELQSKSNFDVSGADRQRLKAELFMNPPAPSERARATATSSATLRATPNNGNGQGDPGRSQEGSLQSNGQTAQARGEGDKVSSKPQEEGLTQADPDQSTIVTRPGPIPVGRPVEQQLKRAATRRFDLRTLPQTRPIQRERPELEPPDHTPVTVEGIPLPPARSAPGLPAPAVQAPAPSIVFDGLDRENWGAGSPPDTNGDVGPTYYIQSVNTSVGIYRKSDGFREAAFTFDTLMSQGNFGNLCDTDNFGDPVVLYDTFDDRWILTDFAFLLDGGGNVVTPAYQCFAVSMSGNPLTGGWNFYSTPVTDLLNDYPKLGVWTDGLYMSANLFSFGAGSTFQGVRVWAFNKAQMYAGSPTVKVVQFNLGTGDFTVVPANARLQTGTPPAGRPNFFLSTWNFLNAVSVYKFHVDWNSISLSTFTGPDVPLAATSWPNANVANAPQPGTATLLDVLQIRAMVQNQYTNFGGAESLWVPHTVRRANTTGFAAPRWYQVNITGGAVAPNLPQATTWDPDAANVIHRFMPSLALDRAGNMAMGYSTSSSTTFPSLKYAGRLSTDPVNTFGQTEQTLFTGTASQTGSTRWGDYSSMMLDPDGCSFWYTNEYANPLDQSFNKRWLTKIGSFKFAECTPVGAGGTVSGTVTDSVTSNPINSATVALGGRTATTNASGVYTFLDIPAGTYPSITASFAGYGPSTATSIVVADAATTTQDFSLTAAPTTACLTDTTQADFLLGVFTNVDLNTSPGDVTLIDLAIDQQNTAGTTTGTGFGTPAWTGQTFTPTVNGQLVAADIQLFCNGCGATPPNLTLSVRNTAAGLPTGADLASVTIPGSVFSSGAAVTFTASFGSPATLTSGTQYALILRPVSVPAGSGYFWIRSSPSTYASGSRVLSADSGGTWSTDTTRDYNFKTYMRGPYSPTSGNLVSSPKDANPSGGLTPIWSTFSWNATTPANTSLRFQLAGSNNVNGPFNFVGPDGTAGTFFTTSPVQLSPQFYNFRFLEYKALLATTDNAATPTLNDATACFNDVDCSSTAATITPSPTSVCTNSTGNSASGPAGMTSYAWGIANGTITSATNIQTITYTAGASGTVTLTLTVTAPNGCIASSSTPVTINPTPPQPTITPNGSVIACDSGTLTSSSATGNQWYFNGNLLNGETNQTLNVDNDGDYTVIVTLNGCSSPVSAATSVDAHVRPGPAFLTAGGPTTFCTGGSVTLMSNSATGIQWYLDGNPLPNPNNQNRTVSVAGTYTVTLNNQGCVSQPSNAIVVTVNPLPPTPTITPGGPTTFCAGGSVTLTSSSASGNQWYLNGNPIGGATNQAYVATAAGDYTNIVTTSGCSSAPSSVTTVTVNPIPATPTITPGGPTAFCAGGSVTLTSSSASGNQWYLNGNPIGGATSQAYVATASGDYTNTVTTTGCTSAPSSATTVTVNPIPATPTITPSGPTTFCEGSGITLNSSSASGNQWYLNGNPIGGATNQDYIATAAGDYTNIVTTSGCSSAPSGSTTVTVNQPTPVVMNTNDSGAGSLRQAISDACDGATITFAPGLAGQTITLTSGELAIDKSLTIQALGSNLLTVSGNNNSRVFNVTVASPGIVSISGLTIASGKVTSADGGGIRNSSSGTINVSNSTLSNNSAINGVGGGIVNFSSGTVNVINSTLSGNSATFGGGIMNSSSGTVNVADSTISGNSASNSGGGIHNTTGTVRVRNSIIALNTAPSNPDVNGTMTSQGHNLIGKSDGSNGFSNGTNGDIMGTTAAPVDPLLAPLANNGGPTQTLALLPGSRAIDAGDNCVTQAAHCGDSYLPQLTTDQRGFARISNTTVDIGAFESRGFTIAVTSGSPQSTPILSAFASALVATVSSAFAEPVAGGVVIFTAPSSGASGAFPGNVTTTTVTINVVGLATSPTFTANGTAGGPYNVVARFGTGLPAANFSLSNLKGNQTITFGVLTNKTFGDPDFPVSAMATSGLSVSFTAAGNCIVSSPSPGTVHLTSAGSCTITASQGGDSNYSAATNVARSFSIAQVATTTALSSSINPSDLGQDVTFTATITPPLNTSTPTGMVQFKDGTNNLGSVVNCAAGGGNTCTAQVTTSTLNTGTHAISAVYSGDINFAGSSGSLSGGQVVTSQAALLLILDESGPNSNQAAALDSVLLLRDAFPVHGLATWYNFGPDRNTRVMVFVANLQLNAGDTASAVVINLIDNNNQSYQVPAEDVRVDPITGFAQVTFRLPDTLYLGVCTITVEAYGHFSNSAIIRIGP